MRGVGQEVRRDNEKQPNDQREDCAAAAHVHIVPPVHSRCVGSDLRHLRSKFEFFYYYQKKNVL